MPTFEDILDRVQKPGHYLGCEVGARHKDPDSVTARVALAYPDLYELAMSYLGLQVLYDAVNCEDDLWAERVFVPRPDMEAALAAAGLPLGSLESRTPLRDFDLVGVTLQHELNLPDVLSMLRLGGIPVASAERDDTHPVVVAGGPGAGNPEPVADAFDAVFLGDGDEAVAEIARLVGLARRRREPRRKILEALAGLPGVYVPSLYRIDYANDGAFLGANPIAGAPARVRRRLLPDLGAILPPARQVLPCAQTVHERLTVEIQRGCTRGCRFCQAGMITRPVRQRSTRQVLRSVSSGLEATGYDQVSFLSLSAGDHPHIIPMLESFFSEHAARRISVSLPSLRAETLTESLAELMRTVRKSGFTIAPEAGTARLRRVINKPITDDDIIQAGVEAFSAGWQLIKLYFMVGLPTETDEDLDAILDLVARMQRELRPRASRARIHVGLSTFVPKPHTPFQWEAMAAPDHVRRIQERLRRGLGAISGVRTSWTRPEMSWAEGVLARGDRRLFAALLDLSASGQRLLGWSEHFDAAHVEQALGPFAEAALSASDPGQPTPWDHLDMGPDRDFLVTERDRALTGEFTPDCAQTGCYECGACTLEGVTPVIDIQPPATRTAAAERPPEARPSDPSCVRLTLSKTGPGRHLGHLEFMKATLRALRRADWPLVHTQGFHPKPKTSFGPACPTGVESHTEMLDVWVQDPGELTPLLEGLGRALPPGVRLVSGSFKPGDAGGIVEAAHAIRYRFHLGNKVPEDQAAAGLRALMDRRSWPVTRTVKGRQKTVDVRPALLSCQVLPGTNGTEAVCELAVANAPAARPSEVAREAFGTTDVRVVREAILFGPDAGEGA